ncbi:unnamed protein product [Allacma fusca]|uniref:Leucine-rich repeat-containing protein 23 n=1 Tax=Allacma fusca TaxID=39272 RepID=A0A8J2K2L1_9HEXA|nr:unnamed protein product [Allacma fusca]
MSVEDFSQLSFDFDYNEDDFNEETPQPEFDQGSEHPSYFGFGLEMPLDSEGDLIFPDEILSDNLIQSSISTVGPVINSFKHAFVKFEAPNQRLSDIDMLSQYIHLRNIDLSNNRIKDLVALHPITFLQVLNVEGNQISSLAYISKLIYLQTLNLSRNEISATTGFPSNKLTYLNLSRNKVSALENFRPDVFPNLLLLELRENLITSLDGVSLPKLENLYVAGNQLQSLAGIENCPMLKVVHARHNMISHLPDFIKLPNLEYINLRNNVIHRFTEVLRLGSAKNLSAVILSSNPIAEDDRYRGEVIIACPASLRRLDKFLIPEAEQAEALRYRRARENRTMEPVLDAAYSTASTPPDASREYQV